MATDTLRAASAHVTPAPASGLLLSDEQLEAYLTARGCIGPYTRKFLDEISWGIASRAFMAALAETSAYPNTVEGHQAFIDEMLALRPDDARALPNDAPVRIVCQRAAAIVQDQMSTIESAETSRG